MAGVMATRDAMRLAESFGLDLVEISPEARPPVCKIMDYGKYCYLESVKEKEAKKNQQNKAIKEMKFHCNIGEHDYQTKLAHTREFLTKGHRVKLTLQFRGRENAHRDLGFGIINRMIKDCSGLCIVDQPPKTMGKLLIAMIAPTSPKQQKQASPAGQPAENTQQNSKPAVPVVPVVAQSQAAVQAQPRVENTKPEVPQQGAKDHASLQPENK